MNAVIEEMEAHRTSYMRAMAVLDEETRVEQPESWRTVEDCANGFHVRDEFLTRREGD
ncbi:MAG TPA: hypothetical protein VI198_07425 [Candidatus Eisenbacteria bacterium]